jgi:plasmid maintenance system killer protein
LHRPPFSGPSGWVSRLDQWERAGQHSVRINDQYRICFAWTAVGPEAVEVVNYY